MKKVVNILKENGKIVPTLVDSRDEIVVAKVKEVVVEIEEEEEEAPKKKAGRPKKSKE